ncbi:MAG TPA: hypothetical protein PLS73_00545 [Saprospiraceae bacterium]|nr:hypothetical protein [Saprospiraceae bacterium]
MDEVYIQNPNNKSLYAKYNSITSYNERLHFPDYVSREQAEPFFIGIGIITSDLQIHSVSFEPKQDS